MTMALLTPILLAGINGPFKKAATALVELGCNVWNGCCTISYELLSSNKYLTGNGTNGAWTFIEDSLYPIFLSIGTALIVLFFVIGYIQNTMDIRQSLTLENSIMIFVRLAVASGFVTLAMTWIPKLFKVAKYLVEAVGLESDGLGTMSADSLTEEIVAFKALAAFPFAFIFFLVCVLGGLVIIITIFKRIFNLYILVLCAPIALSTLAGGNQLNSTAYSYIKTFLGTCFECVVIAVVLAVGGYFVADGGTNLFADTNSAAAVKNLIGGIISVTCVTTAVKSSDVLIRRAFGFPG